jgi:limonene 1,2-monooxygenase
MSDFTDLGALKFGLFHGPHHDKAADPLVLIERDLKLMQHLDSLGYEEAWIGEHHTGAFEMISAPELFVMQAAERTRHIRLGTGVKSLPYHNPFMLAETMAQLDWQTRGRAMFGVGPGAMVTDAGMLGIAPNEMRPRMEEALDAIVPLMRGERVTMKTDGFDLVDAKLHVGCFTKPMMEMAVTSVRSPSGVLAAGKYGLGLLTLGGISDNALAKYRQNWQIYEEQCAKHGHVADRAKFRITMFIHLAETREKALADVR